MLRGWCGKLHSGMRISRVSACSFSLSDAVRSEASDRHERVLGDVTAIAHDSRVIGASAELLNSLAGI